MRVRACLAACLLACAPGGCPAAAEDDPRIQDVIVARWRADDKVTVEGVLRSPDEADLADLEVTFERIDPSAVVRPSDPFRRSLLSKGKRCRFFLSLVRCPSFASYRIRLRATLAKKAREWSWTAQRLAEPPVAEPDAQKRAALASVSQEVGPGKKPGTITVTCKVRNDGAVPARSAAARLRFLRKGSVVRETLAVLGNGRVDPGETAELPAVVPEPPEYDKVEAVPSDLRGTEIPIGGGDFAGDPLVEAAGFGFEKLDGGGLLVTGLLRNGLDHAVHGMVITVVLEGEGGREAGRIEARVPGPVYSGEIAPWTGLSDKGPEFLNFSYSLTLKHDLELKEKPALPDEEPVPPSGEGK